MVKSNGIEIPRVRGYRLMKDEDPISEEEIIEQVNSIYVSEVENVIGEVREFGMVMYRGLDDEEKEQYFVLDSDGWPVKVKLESFHGKQKRRVKTLYYLVNKVVRRQWEMWNRYAGQKDVLYIHAKQGRINWSNTTWKDFQKKDWFIAAIDDSFDSCYCDIYARLKV